MMNTNLINEAVRLVAMINEANYIYETDYLIRPRVEKWYNNTDITDAEMLAAVALNGDYNPRVTYNEMVAAKEFYFPSIPVEYTATHIHAIEAALNDELWME